MPRRAWTARNSTDANTARFAATCTSAPIPCNDIRHSLLRPRLPEPSGSTCYRLRPCPQWLESRRLRADNIWIGEPAIQASSTIDGQGSAGIEHRFDVAFTIEIEVGSMQHERDISDFCICLGEVQ